MMQLEIVCQLYSSYCCIFGEVAHDEADSLEPKHKVPV
jgi:hypothetical protein